jgi:hypothetical protein
VLRSGERVVPTPGGGGGMTVVVESGMGGTSVERHLAAMFTELIRSRAIQLTVRNDRVAVA